MFYLLNKYFPNKVDELFFYNISIFVYKILIEKYYILKVSEIINMPFGVSRRIKSFSDVKEILCVSANKISINFYVINNLDLISRISDKFGR
ncbi:MAG: hypothetical protein G8D27_01470 [Buchnera aphidicola (Periphyllus aceris)]|nr:hypothetical protein [Buchnera aphidicola (Periphyllus aceris)]